MRMKSDPFRGTPLSWMNSEFASWEVEGQVYERVNNVLEDAEKHRFTRQALNAKGFPTRNGLWILARVALSRLTGYLERVDLLLEKRLSSNQNQTEASLTSKFRQA